MADSLLDMLAEQVRGGTPISEPTLTPEQQAQQVQNNIAAAIQSGQPNIPEWGDHGVTQEMANAASMATGNLSIPVGSSTYAPTPQEQLYAPLGYGFGPDYKESGDYPENRTPLEPAGLNYSDSAIADNWEDFKSRDRSTGGGFFTAEDLFGSDMPWAFQKGSNFPSTNNWRLLPSMYRHPNFIMRNGQIINMNSPTMYGPFGGPPLNEELSGSSWRSGAAVGYPVAWSNSPVGYAYAGWPGQLGPYSYHAGTMGGN